MAKLPQTYVADDLPKSDRNFEPLPDGWYAVTVTEADVKETKARNGSYLKLRLDVTGPTHQGRVVFTMITLKNANPAAEDIGAKQLGEMMLAVGLARLDDSDQLIGRSLSVKLKTESSPEYGDQNKVSAYKAIGGATSTAAPGAAPPAAKAAPPWAKK